MKRCARQRLITMLSCVPLLAMPACFDPPPCDLAGLSIDANQNGFPDVIPPDGVPFETASNLNIGFSSSLTLDDVSMIAAQLGVDPGLLSAADLTIHITLTADYENGVQDRLTCSTAIRPIDLAFEIACPSAADLMVEVQVDFPPFGTVAEIPVDLSTTGNEFDCGQTVETEVFINDDGLLDHRLDVRDNPS